MSTTTFAPAEGVDVTRPISVSLTTSDGRLLTFADIRGGISVDNDKPLAKALSRVSYLQEVAAETASPSEPAAPAPARSKKGDQ